MTDKQDFSSPSAVGLTRWTLLLHLSGPLQSWGTSSRFDERDTQREPSKSGVIGLCCAALGRDRVEAVDDLVRLRMGVRIDDPGVPWRDFQTATGVMLASGQVDAGRTVLSNRHYLADAAFLVGLEGDDEALLRQVHAALRSPRWPLWLGRKSCPPGLPVWLPDAVVAQPLELALSGFQLPDTHARRPRWQRTEPEGGDRSVEMVIESDGEGSLRLDQPAGPFSTRAFTSRWVVRKRLAARALLPQEPA